MVLITASGGRKVFPSRKHFIDDILLAIELGNIELGREVVVVKDKLHTEQFKEKGNEEYMVGRSGCMDQVKPFFYKKFEQRGALSQKIALAYSAST